VRGCETPAPTPAKGTAADDHAPEPRLRRNRAAPGDGGAALASGVTHPADRPLINVSQAAPVDPPLGLRQALAEAALNNPDAHLYGPVLGLPALRAEIATQWSAPMAERWRPAQVAITQGCNQAFTAVMSTLAGAGDEVILPTPWYFNHKMWLDMHRRQGRAAGYRGPPDP
jgi:aspartate/methionine/tyrosine aminotransferase